MSLFLKQMLWNLFDKVHIFKELTKLQNWHWLGEDLVYPV